MEASTEVMSAVEIKTEEQRLLQEFYCGATLDQIPPDVLFKVVGKMVGMWEYIETKYLAAPLRDEGLLNHSEFLTLMNDCVPLLDRRNNLLYTILPSKGDQRKILAKFYYCMLHSQIPQEIPQKLRTYALEVCQVDRPVISPGVSTGTAIGKMVSKLVGKRISEESAKDLAKSLDLTGDELGDPPELDLGEIFQKWVSKDPNASAPEGLVEALVCTKGLGKLSSGLAIPTNPPDVQSFFLNLGEKWLSMASFLGYTKNDLEESVTEIDSTYQQQIARFLTMFEMPDCGTRSVPILHKAAQKAGFSSGVPRKKRTTYSLGLTDTPDLSQLKQSNYAKGMPSLELHEAQPKSKLASNNPQGFEHETPTTVPGFFNWGFPPPPPWVPPPQLVSALQTLTSYIPPPQMWAGQLHFRPRYHPPCTGYQDQQYTQAVHESLASRAQWEQRHVEDTQWQDNDMHARVSEAKSGKPSAAEVTSAQPMKESASYSQDSNRYDYERNSKSDLIIQCRKTDDPAAVEVVSGLLESGGSLKIKTEEDGSLPLHLAVLSKSFQMLSLLVGYYSSVNMIDAVRDDHKTALMVACLEKAYEFVRLLLENGADANAKDCDGLSCLHYKATLESPDIVQLLIDKGAEVDNLADGTLSTPLTHACHYGQVESAEILLSVNANPHGLPGAVITPLCATVEAGHERLVYLLLDHHADINFKDKVGSTPILRACKNGKVNFVSKLINLNADLDIADKEGNTPILVAVEKHNVEMLQLLVACKAEVNHRKAVQSGTPPKEFEITPLILAAGRGHLDMVEILVENKANVNYCSSRTVSALSFAVGGGHAEIVEYFLKVNEVTKTIDGLSVPLIMAVGGEDQYIIKLLLDVFGGYEKALHLATEAGIQQLVNSLCRLDDRVQRRVHAAAASSEATNENLQPLHCLSQREMHSHIDQTLNEFVCAAITTAERKQERSAIIEEARSTGNEHVVLFLEQYFAIADGSHPVPFFGEFINAIPFPSPAYFLFGNGKLFDGVTFKAVLEDMKSNVVELLPIALMQMFQADVPDSQGLSQGLDTFDGTLLMDTLLGPRFHQEVKSLGLLDPPKPPPRPVPRASVSGTESVPTDTADHDEQSSSPLPPESVKPPERVERPAPPTMAVSDDELPELTPSGLEQPEQASELEADHVTSVTPVDTTDTEEISQSIPDVSRDTDPPLQVEGARINESPRGTRIHESPRGHRPSRIPIRLQRTKSVPASKVENPLTSASCQSASPHGLKEPFSFSRQQSAGPIHGSNEDSSVNPTASVKKLPDDHSRNQDKASRTSAAPVQAALKTPDKKQRDPPTPAMLPKTGASRIAQRKVCGIPFPVTAIRDSRKLFKHFAGRITQWRALAQFLKANNVHDIDTKYEFQNEKCYRMLCSWRTQFGNEATYIQLAEGFKHVKQEYLIKELHDYIQPSMEKTTSGENCYKTEIDIDSSDDLLKFHHEFHQFIADGKDNGSKTASIRIELR